MSKQKVAIIIGAGPAGLTAAYELLKHTSIKPIIFEASNDIGGISKTVNYKGNRIDIGGHRFFSKSDRVMNWWVNLIPIEQSAKDSLQLHYQNKTTSIKPNTKGPSPDKQDLVMLIRSRLSRIFYLRQFFSYPISLSLNTVLNLGIARIFSILFSYIFSSLFPRKPERSLEDFLINRFGFVLYKTFFKDYTEKVWGTACSNISAEWGAQRIKGLSIRKTIWHALKKPFQSKSDIRQKHLETSLIEQFIYPKYGPGQMWEETARQVQDKGARLHIQHTVKKLHINNNTVYKVDVYDHQHDQLKTIEGDYFFSTMPVKTLINSITGQAIPKQVTKVANGLVYRDFITVGVLLKKLHLTTKGSKAVTTQINDNWIYIQERDVKVGRIQIFNNWSPYMVKDPATTWLGLEYFCNQDDDLWSLSDDAIKTLAIDELKKLQFIASHDVLDSTVIRVPKTYPAYFGTYDQFNDIRSFVDPIENLFLIGRNGMHKYNNQDHSMLTAMEAVTNISKNITTKDNIWDVNTEMDYHEKK